MKLHEIQRLQKLAGIINEIKVTDPSIENTIKEFILTHIVYGENDFEAYYNADSNIEDLVQAGEYVERIFLELNSTEDEEELLDLIKGSSKVEHKPGGDYYENKWLIEKYPFEDRPEEIEWTEELVVRLQIPNGNYDVANVFNDNYGVANVFNDNYGQVLEIRRSIPFDNGMVNWWGQ
jgi:hypothetical protein